MSSKRPLSSQEHRLPGMDDAIEFYYQQGWTDGLPVVPPTPEKVHAALERAGLAPSDVLGVVPVRGRVITAEKAAINAVMAGCLPEYMPVVAAAVQAICEDPYNLHGTTASTMGASVLLVVNGPVRERLDFNSGGNALGAGRRANATVGRAMRLILMNVCGATPGVMDQSTLGHPGKYSFCFAEDEESSPWAPLHVERGLAADTSAVTAFAALAPCQVENRVGNTPESVLRSIADTMLAFGPGQGEMIVVIARELMGPIQEAGWSKGQVREFLHLHARRTLKEWLRVGKAEPDSTRGEEDRQVPVCRIPDDIVVIPAGGEAGVWAAVIPMWGGGVTSRSVTREIDTSGL